MTSEKTTDKIRLRITLDNNVKSIFDEISTQLGLKNNGEVLTELIKAYQENEQLKQESEQLKQKNEQLKQENEQLKQENLSKLSYIMLGLEDDQINEVKNAEKVSNQSLQAIAKDGLLQRSRYLNSVNKIDFDSMTDDKLKKTTAKGSANFKITAMIEKIKEYNDNQSDNSTRFYISPSFIFKLTNSNFKIINNYFNIYRVMIDDINNKYGLSDKDNRKGKGFDFKKALGIVE